jgi:hypothetical protein
MNQEYHSLRTNDYWDLVHLVKGRKPVPCKWVYRTKYASDGSVERHKAQLVAKGFSQVEGIDYNETFSPVAKMNSICLVLALATSHKWEVHKMDVKSTFLHEELQEEIYMEQPPCSFDKSFQILASTNNIQPPFGPAIRVPSSLPKI